MIAKRDRYSVTALMTYEACPYQYYTAHVRKIPPPRSPEMLRGASIHNVISRYYRGQPIDEAGISGEVGALLNTFLESRFNVSPVASEKAFVEPVRNGDVRGRIDVVLPRRGSGLEVVDFKSGSGRSREDLSRRLQLPLYALAASRLFQVPLDDIAYTYFNLNTRVEERFVPDVVLADAVVDRTETIIDRIQAGEFEPRPGCSCYACAWRRKRFGPRDRGADRGTPQTALVLPGDAMSLVDD